MDRILLFLRLALVGCDQGLLPVESSTRGTRTSHSFSLEPIEGRTVMASQQAIFAAGCFWGVEEAFREMPGVISTAVGYIGGTTKNPSYEHVCMDGTGHAEAVLVEYDPTRVTYDDLLERFWKIHDPTQVNRQGPDFGTQYRTAIFYTSDEQRAAAEKSKEQLSARGKHRRPIATEIVDAPEFYRAEEYHQQYFAKRGQPSCHTW
jgi:peptide-methionine (S)-S-oxide reductase